MPELVVADIGGTHARFAIAEVESGRVRRLGPPVTLKTQAHADLEDAWREFGRQIGRELPPHASLAVAAPVSAEVIKLTNSNWSLRPARLQEALGLQSLTLVNDWGAVAHGVHQFDPEHFVSLCGPNRPLPNEGVITIIGPGTGFGVAQLVRRNNRHMVIETEGGHVDFAPLDELEDALLTRLRARHNHVSVERVVSGPGLAAIYETIAEQKGGKVQDLGDQALWTLALNGEDPLLSEALERFFLCLGAVAGNLALAQGASAVVIAGGIVQRSPEHLARSGFGARFTAKGRFASMMENIPVKLITHSEPGLFGAAAAFAGAQMS